MGPHSSAKGLSVDLAIKREIHVGSMEAEIEKIEDLIDGEVRAGSETRVRIEFSNI